MPANKPKFLSDPRRSTTTKRPAPTLATPTPRLSATHHPPLQTHARLRRDHDHRHGRATASTFERSAKKRPACPRPNLSPRWQRSGKALWGRGSAIQGDEFYSHHRPENMRTRCNGLFKLCREKWFRLPRGTTLGNIASTIMPTWTLRGGRKTVRIAAGPRKTVTEPNYFLQTFCFSKKPLLDWYAKPSRFHSAGIAAQ